MDDVFPPQAPPTDLARLIAEADGPPQVVSDFARANPRASSLVTRLYPARYAIAGLALLGTVAVVVAQPWKGSPPPFRSTDDAVEFSTMTPTEEQRLPDFAGVAPASVTDLHQTVANFGYRGPSGASGGIALTLAWSADGPFPASEREAFTTRLSSSRVFSPVVEGLPIDGHTVYEQHHGNEQLRTVVESGVVCLVVGRTPEAARAALVQLVHDEVDTKR